MLPILQASTPLFPFLNRLSAILNGHPHTSSQNYLEESLQAFMHGEKYNRTGSKFSVPIALYNWLFLLQKPNNRRKLILDQSTLRISQAGSIQNANINERCEHACIKMSLQQRKLVISNFKDAICVSITNEKL